MIWNRGGRAGGYKELDEEEIEETRRRRKEAEAVRKTNYIHLLHSYFMFVKRLITVPPLSFAALCFIPSCILV